MAIYTPRFKPIYLYSNGTENEIVTGGLTAYDYVTSTSSSIPKKPTISKGSTTMTISLPDATGSSSGGTVFTENKIDLTKAKTIYLNVTNITVDASSYVRFGVLATKENKYTFAAATTIRSNGTLSLDVADLSGSYYLVISMLGVWDKSVEFTEWWIE